MQPHFGKTNSISDQNGFSWASAENIRAQKLLNLDIQRTITSSCKVRARTVGWYPSPCPRDLPSNRTSHRPSREETAFGSQQFNSVVESESQAETDFSRYIICYSHELGFGDYRGENHPLIEYIFESNELLLSSHPLSAKQNVQVFRLKSQTSTLGKRLLIAGTSVKIDI